MKKYLKLLPSLVCSAFLIGTSSVGFAGMIYVSDPTMVGNSMTSVVTPVLSPTPDTSLVPITITINTLSGLNSFSDPLPPLSPPFTITFSDPPLLDPFAPSAPARSAPAPSAPTPGGATGIDYGSGTTPPLFPTPGSCYHYWNIVDQYRYDNPSSARQSTTADSLIFDLGLTNAYFVYTRTAFNGGMTLYYEVYYLQW